MFGFGRKKKAVKAFNAFDEAVGWFQENGIDDKSINFSVYHDFARNPGASVVVGAGPTKQGRVGFVVEVIHGEGVIDSAFIVPEGVATYHRRASMEARAYRMPLMDVLLKYAEIQRKQQAERVQ